MYSRPNRREWLLLKTGFILTIKDHTGEVLYGLKSFQLAVFQGFFKIFYWRVAFFPNGKASSNLIN